VSSIQRHSIGGNAQHDWPSEEQWQYYFKVERKQPDIELGGN
jgi:hypothetical protein